jgi:hypothetical protein
MKWKDTPNSWFGFPGKLIQFGIDNVMGLFGKDPDDPKGEPMDYEIICPNDGTDLVNGICPKCGYTAQAKPS